jgi:hypothetical protein
LPALPPARDLLGDGCLRFGEFDDMRLDTRFTHAFLQRYVGSRLSGDRVTCIAVGELGGQSGLLELVEAVLVGVCSPFRGCQQ